MHPTESHSTLSHEQSPHLQYLLVHRDKGQAQEEAEAAADFTHQTVQVVDQGLPIITFVKLK